MNEDAKHNLKWAIVVIAVLAVVAIGVLGVAYSTCGWLKSDALCAIEELTNR